MSTPAEPTTRRIAAAGVSISPDGRHAKAVQPSLAEKICIVSTAGGRLRIAQENGTSAAAFAWLPPAFNVAEYAALGVDQDQTTGIPAAGSGVHIATRLSRSFTAGRASAGQIAGFAVILSLASAVSFRQWQAIFPSLARNLGLEGQGETTGRPLGRHLRKAVVR